MKTLVFFDTKGTIFYAVSEPYTLPAGGIQYLEADVPDGLCLKAIDISGDTPKPVFYDYVTADIIVSTLESVEELKEQIKANAKAISDAQGMINLVSDASGSVKDIADIKKSVEDLNKRMDDTEKMVAILAG